MDLFTEILKGNKIALSKGITLIESNRKDQRNEAEKLISNCLPYSGNSMRIGITGIPGVGKSTFIESFGSLLTEKGEKVAVLAIDPTSEKTQGSILGDKIRMQKLSINKNAFIRPSPNKNILGGITNTTRDSIILCEAAGYNIILVETVGVGQNEITVSKIVDFFLLLTIYGTGDELQAIKKGIIEQADAIIVNKSDGENIKKAEKACLEYKNITHILATKENGWLIKTGICSSIEKTGLSNIIKFIYQYKKQMLDNQFLIENRKKQNKYWLNKLIKEEIGNRKYQELIENGDINRMEQKIMQEEETIYQILKKI